MPEERYDGRFDVEGGNFRNAGQVSSKIKNILKDIGCSSDIVRRAAIVTYEAEINIVSYARKGQIHLLAEPDLVRICVDDEGPGIADIELAMQEGYSTAPAFVREMGFGAGMGLANMKKYSNDFEISSVVDVGTQVKMIINRSEG
ncbi:MAG TPA: ATP-binding protein [Syntrophales bacterium]|nr:ATP-binding protein [Syntrophobacterales bacterium]HRT27383.1 ATP-binding protein [Syntrophales bacterium]HRT70776.1 ATP-binding protein [Syntrophales bacterium]